MVAPHPDDELLGAGGLIRTCTLGGQRVTIVSVTDGEMADEATPDLGSIRRHELVKALRTLCSIHVKVEHLRIPDGRVGQHENKLRIALTNLLTPSVTLVAPLESDGHPDHDAVGHVCRQVASVHGIPNARYPIWAWHHSRPEAYRSLRWRIHQLSSDAQRAKARAIEQFHSQLKPVNGEPILPPHVLTHFKRPYEAFVL